MDKTKAYILDIALRVGILPGSFYLRLRLRINIVLNRRWLLCNIATRDVTSTLD